MDVKPGMAMTAKPTAAGPAAAALRLRAGLSRVALGLALALLAASFLLISPMPGQTYPGAIPWRDGSVLRSLTELMSLHGLVASGRGVEVKELALHLAAAAGLALLGVAWLVGRAGARAQAGPAVVAGYGQLLLALWAGLCLLSTLWSGDPELAAGQSLLYALSVAWAVALGQTLERRHIGHLLAGLTMLSVLAAGLAVWYFYERNPHHRVGFPVGNPNVLAALLLPGVLTAVLWLGRGVHRAARERDDRAAWLAVGAAAALTVLVWCLTLTGGRGALLALAVGVAALAVWLARGRVRWVLAGVAGLAIVGGAWLLYESSRLDVTMARGATVRFRLYAWRYAAQLWNSRPVAGHGAGSYPRLAGRLADHDEAFDPGAFMGQIVEHAHNELFEVLSEIGLVGGVTFVGGFVATLAAAAALLRRHRGPQAWEDAVLVAGVVALLADGLVGATQRLPGGPAVLFTQLGALWAACRTAERPDGAAGATGAAGGLPGRSSGVRRVGRWAAGALCLAAAAGAGVLAGRNWRAVGLERDAALAWQAGRYAEALEGITRAEAGLLDPVSKLAARDTALRCRLELAREAVALCVLPVATAAAGAPWRQAERQAREAYDAALALRQRVPALKWTDAAAARAAEWLALLHRHAGRGELSRQWTAAAEAAWRRQRLRTPYDVETLLALLRYPATVADQVLLLRDSLRVGGAEGDWLEALRQLAQAGGFEEVLESFRSAAAPITPDTDVDAVVASMAPEMHRLAAAWHGLRGEYAAAAEASARAARLYAPLRSRFPELYPRALAEQAEYLLRASPDEAARAVALLRAALKALPLIQAQKYAELTRPYRFRLALCLLAAGSAEEAVDVVGSALGEQAEEPQALERTLEFLLGELAARGMPAEVVTRARSALAARFPALGATETADE